MAVFRDPGFGNIFARAIASPAVGTNLSTAIPAGRIWRILSLRFLFTTDATVANRRVVVTLRAPVVGEFCAHVSNGTQVASLTLTYNFFSSLQNLQLGSIQMGSIGPQIMLPGHFIETEIQLLQAGDQISEVALYVEEWFT